MSRISTAASARQASFWDETPDDGFVLIEGKLWTPQDVTRAAAQKFRHHDGRAPRSAIARYAENYPVPDLTTPTSREFKVKR